MMHSMGQRLGLTEMANTANKNTHNPSTMSLGRKSYGEHIFNRLLNTQIRDYNSHFTRLESELSALTVDSYDGLEELAYSDWGE